MTRLPVTGPFRVTATYGQKGSHWATHHRGIDLVAEDPRIFCTCYGTVRTVAYDKNGWGYYVSVGDAEDQRHIFCRCLKGCRPLQRHTSCPWHFSPQPTR